MNGFRPLCVVDLLDHSAEQRFLKVLESFDWLLSLEIFYQILDCPERSVFRYCDEFGSSVCNERTLLNEKIVSHLWD